MLKLTESAALQTGSFTSDRLTIELLPNLERLSIAPLKGEDQALRDHLARAGVELPGPVEATLSPLLVLPLGRGQWLMQGECPDITAISAQVCVTDQSDAWCAFQLGGEAVPALLERLVAPAPSNYISGRAVRTQIEHIGCWVVGLDNNEWQILGPRSSAESLFDALKSAAETVTALLNNTEV